VSSSPELLFLGAISSQQSALSQEKPIHRQRRKGTQKLTTDYAD
jgi:hypothetical protein